MKKNNLGFMLAELVIVSGVVIVAIFSLYAGFSNVFVQFKEQSKYYSADAMYMARNMMTFFIDENKMNTMISKIGVTNFLDISNCADLNIYNEEKETNICNDLKNVYNVNKMFFVKKSGISTLQSSDINQTFKDYINFFDNNESSMTDSGEHYYIMVETTDLYYGSIKIS